MEISMRDLSDVLPMQEISAYFSKEVLREELRMADLNEVTQLCPSDMFSLAVNCAIRAKQLFKQELDMIPLVPDLQLKSPHLIATLSTVLGEKALDDLYCCRCTVDGQQVASLLVAQVWPRDLYVGMVMFADPTKPLPEHERKSVLHKFRGLGLLTTFVRRLEACAEAHKCRNITLRANETSQMQLFKKYGFVVDGYPAALDAVEDGRSIPMHKSTPN
ncbi:MAG: GNAT family N-acetyltransferase [Pirellulales bacterium]